MPEALDITSQNPYSIAMPATSITWNSPKPQFAVHFLYSKSDGRCLATTFYKIVSLHRLSRKFIDGVRAANLIGGGQEWCVRSKCDGTEEPAGKDLVSAIEINNMTGEIVNLKPVHSSGVYFQPIEVFYYEYLIEDTCDSSD